jgi:hypothetical protein
MATFIDASPTAEITELPPFYNPYSVSEPQNLQTPTDRRYHFPSSAALPNGNMQMAQNQQLYAQPHPMASMAPEMPSMISHQESMSVQTSRNISPMPYNDYTGLAPAPGTPQQQQRLPTAKKERAPPAANKASRMRKSRRRSETTATGRSAANRAASGGPGAQATLLSNGSGGRSGKGQDASKATRPSKPKLELTDSAPADLKKLLELRKLCYDEKGRGMWDEITRLYNAEYGEHDRARLQMKLTRGVNRYAKLPESEVCLSRLFYLAPLEP